MGSDVSAWCPWCLFLPWVIRRIYHAEDRHKRSEFAFVLQLFVAEILASPVIRKNLKKPFLGHQNIYCTSKSEQFIETGTIQNVSAFYCSNMEGFPPPLRKPPALLSSSIEINLSCGPQSRASTANLLQWNKAWKALIGFETSPFMLKLLALWGFLFRGVAMVRSLF